MRRCSVCHSFLVPVNEGIDHIAFRPYVLSRSVYICQGCLHALQDQLEYGMALVG